MDTIDQYIFANPEYVLGDAIEDAVIGLENNPVYAQHILCAAREHPLTEADREWFDGERLDRAVEMWIDAGKLDGDLSRSVRYTGSPRPQSDIPMYTTSGTQFNIRCRDGEIDMEPIDKERAYRDHHEDAFSLHNGAQYEVIEFNEDVPNPYVTVQEVRTNEYTETVSEKTVRNLDPEATRDLGNWYHLAWGTGTVEIHYTHFQRKEISSGKATTLMQPTGLPPIELNTHLIWIQTPPSLQDEILREITGEDPLTLTDGDVMEIFGGGLHGAEHGMIKLTPLELRMDKSDLGGLSTHSTRRLASRRGSFTMLSKVASDSASGFINRSRRLLNGPESESRSATVKEPVDVLLALWIPNVGTRTAISTLRRQWRS